MAKYIDADKAIEALINEGRTVDSRYLESERIIHESDAIEAIAMMPEADVRENRHGFWRISLDEPRGTMCSICGFTWSERIDAVKLHPVFSRIETNFCPNCGADMRGEQE